MCRPDSRSDRRLGLYTPRPKVIFAECPICVWPSATEYTYGQLSAECRRCGWFFEPTPERRAAGLKRSLRENS